MGTGKSTVGRQLGRQLDAPVLDTDKELRRAFDLSVPDIFTIHGEAAFRAEEQRLLETLADERGSFNNEPRQFPRRYILSTGGGTPVRPENRDLLKRIGHIVWLRAKRETIAGRCRPHLERRPVLQPHAHHLDEHIGSLLEEREPIYEELADSIVWTDDTLTPEQVAALVRGSLPKLGRPHN